MVEIPDSLRSVFSATVREDDGAYTIELPPGEIAHEGVVPGRTYRVAILESPGTPAEDGQASGTGSGSGGSRTDRQQGPPRPPVEEGEVREVTVETLGDQGDGIAKVERGYVVIVPEAQPGEQPVVEIEQVRRNVAFAKVIDPDERTL